MQLFYSLGALAYRYRWIVISVWLLLLAASAPLFLQAGERLQFGGLTSPRMESVRAQELLERELGADPSNLVVLFSSPDLTADDPEFNRQVEYALAGLRDAPGVQEIVSHQANPRQVSADGHTVYELVVLSIDAEQAARNLEQFTSRLRDPATMGDAETRGRGDGERREPQLPSHNPQPLKMWVTGGPIFFSEVERLSHQDLLRAEIIAFPFAAVALLLVFGSLVATGIPIALGGASVLVIMAGIALMSRATDLSIFVINVATMLGLGLGLDYSLFMTSRFREELEHRSVGEAVAVSVATAGKAVFFSGLAVMIGLMGLASFEFVMLRSLGLVGMMGVAVCLAAALTLLPAVLGALGPQVNRWPVLPDREGFRGFWQMTAGWVMRHPLKVFLPTMALLILLGTPFLHVRFSAPDAYILPPHLPSRQALELLRSEFGDGETAPIVVLVSAEGSIYEPENLSKLYDFTHTVGRDSRVSEIESIVDLDPRITKAQYELIYADPSRIADRYGYEVARRTVGETATVVRIATHTSPVSEESKDLVRQIRQMALPEGMSVQVTGTSAEVLDVVDTLYSDAPSALLFIVVAIYGILLVLFRSVVLPAKALLMNTLSILASYGALVFIFQDGNFQSILGFEATGTIEASMPVILFCIVFGLSMDYEVFLLTRIKEEYDRTGDNAYSVAKGLERSGRLITSAAIIVVVVGLAFAAADIVIIKALGLGIAISVFLDSTVVRTLLVPATMRLLGKWNWWMPGRREGETG
jgi:putative drug exporter of the RND superfamily